MSEACAPKLEAGTLYWIHEARYQRDTLSHVYVIICNFNDHHCIDEYSMVLALDAHAKTRTLYSSPIPEQCTWNPR